MTKIERWISPQPGMLEFQTKYVNLSTNYKEFDHVIRFVVGYHFDPFLFSTGGRTFGGRHV